MPLTLAEALYEGYSQRWDLDADFIVDEQSDFQRIQIFESPGHGKVLALDGIVQLTERDECTYSEMLSHVPILEHGAVRRVMIVGGGDGAIAEEVLKHAGIEGVDLVDIDGRVIDLCRAHFATVSGPAFRDPRLSVHAVDAVWFLEEGEAARYDLIIADRPDPVGPAAVLFAARFYELIRRALRPGGVAVFQTGVPFYQAEELTEAMAQMTGVFARTGVYVTVTPTYVGGFMALTWASDAMALSGAVADLDRRVAAAGIATDYYSAAIHRAAFVLPPFIARLIPPRDQM